MRIEGEGSIPPELKATYTSQFKEGFQLFQDSFVQFQASDGEKKAKFKDVMDKALQVMNETARTVLGKKALKQENQLEIDYHNMVDNESENSRQKLDKDIQKLQDSL